MALGDEGPLAGAKGKAWTPIPQPSMGVAWPFLRSPPHPCSPHGLGEGTPAPRHPGPSMHLLLWLSTPRPWNADMGLLWFRCPPAHRPAQPQELRAWAQNGPSIPSAGKKALLGDQWTLHPSVQHPLAPMGPFSLPRPPLPPGPPWGRLWTLGPLRSKAAPCLSTSLFSPQCLASFSQRPAGRQQCPPSQAPSPAPSPRAPPPRTSGLLPGPVSTRARGTRAGAAGASGLGCCWLPPQEVRGSGRVGGRRGVRRALGPRSIRGG